MIIYLLMFFFFFFKQKTAYEMRISDWSSDVCSSDLPVRHVIAEAFQRQQRSAIGPVRIGAGLRPLQRQPVAGQPFPVEQFAGIDLSGRSDVGMAHHIGGRHAMAADDLAEDRKSTRLNSSH